MPFFVRPISRYAIAALAVAVAALARHGLARAVGELPTYITFYPAVMLAAILAGLGPGLVATLLAALAADYWFLEPRGSFTVASMADAVGLGLFSGMGVMMSLVAESYRRARGRAAAYEKERAVREEQARAAAEILRQKNLLAVTLASIGDGVIVTDAQGRVTFLNAEAQRLTGWQNQEACGHPLPAVFHIINERTRRPVENPVEKVLRLGTVVGLANHTVLISKDGREIPIDDSGAPIRQGDGAVQGVVLVFRDCAEQKQHERALARLAAIVESSDDAILSKDLHGNIQTWNAGAQRLFGYRAEEAIGRPITLLLPPERLPEEEQILERVRNGQPVEHLETVRVAKDGKRLDVSVTVSPIKDQEGQIVGASKIIRDVTERRRAEERMRQAKEEWEQTFNTVPDLIAILDQQYGIVRVNRAMAQRLAVQPEDCVGLPCYRCVHGAEAPPAFCPHSLLLADGQAHTAEVREARLGGDFLVTATPLHDAQGRLIGSVHVARDITKSKQAEEALQASAAELARSNQDLEQFAYVASHDLQEPLRMVAGYVELLRERYQGQLDDKADKYIAYAVDGAARMSTLIRDLLDYSRVNTRGKEPQSSDSRQALDIALRSLTSAVKESGAVITHDPLPIVRADQTQLRQLFQNLIGNAVKFRRPDQPPRIHISVSQGQGHWLFSVRDNGIGFKQEYHDKLFQVFQRLHGRGKYPGTGIGLAICKRIVERHGGRIWATGEPGQGSTFSFTIPL